MKPDQPAPNADGSPNLKAPRSRSRRVKLFNGRYRLGEMAFIGIITSLVALTGFATLANILQSGLSSDSAAWAQAAGSIIAIAGAAWLARGEARQARRWRRQQGEEAAWSVRFVLMQSQFEAQIIAAELTQADKPIDVSKIKSWRQRASNVSLALQTMLTRVDQIHPAITLSASNAKILVDGLSLDLETMEERMVLGETPPDNLVDDIVSAHINLGALIDQYDARARGIQEALDRGDDMLPLKKWTH